MQNRRLVLAMLTTTLPALGALTACAPKSKAGPVTSDDVSMGSDKAPVTLVEYASVACPVCARFNNEVFPDFKKKYIDTGQVRYVAREMLAHNASLAAAGFLLARCAGKDKYFQVTDAIYHARDAMEQSGQYREGLLKIAASVGMSDKDFDTCTQDPAAIEALTNRVQVYSTRDGVDATPTFMINGAKVAEGFTTLQQLDAIVAAAKAAPKPAA